MSEHGPEDVFGWLAENWCERLGDSLETMAGARPSITCQPAQEAPPESAEILWWEQPFSLGPGATVWIGTPQATWAEVGGQILHGAGIEATDPQDSKNTYLEVLSQAFAGLAQAIGSRLKTEVNPGDGQENTPPPEDAVTYETEITLGETALPRARFAVAAAMRDLFRTDIARANAEAPEGESGYEDAPAETAGGSPPRTLELLMELELPVSVSFGRAQLPLKDVLKLSTGSIVELNRAVSEPVEVIVNNCVIARGEVVVVEGNYGVRIHEIISREKRLRTLE